MKTAVGMSVLALLLIAMLAPAGGGKYSLKPTTAEPPKELNGSIAKLLTKEAMQFHDPQGNLVCEVWLRQQVPADATPSQVKNGLTYREIPETTVLGAIRFAKTWEDYKKQPIKAGVYTLRLAYQPQDGDHMGTAPYPDFCLITAAAKDTSAKTLEKKEMIEKSAETMGATHPGVLLLFPTPKPGASPQIGTRPGNHVSIDARLTVTPKGQKDAVMGIGLNLVGHTE